MITILETQTAREEKIRNLVLENCPRLKFHSRVGRGALRACLPRLRFDRRVRFFWLTRLVVSANDLDAAALALVITGPESSVLDLRTGWSDIEIRIYDSGLTDQAKEIAEDYSLTTGREATVVADFREKKSLWRPVYGFTLAIALISLGVLAARLFSISVFKNLFNL